METKTPKGCQMEKCTVWESALENQNCRAYQIVLDKNLSEAVLEKLKKYYQDNYCTYYGHGQFIEKK